MTRRGPRVTVVVSCFNEQRFIEDCLESIQSQTLKSWRCIVVDDASTDDSVPIVLEAADSDRRIRLVRHTKNSGLPAVRNTGLRLTDTEFVCFLDGDDFLLAESLEARSNRLAELSDRADVAGVYHGIIQVGENAQPSDFTGSLARDGDAFRDFLSSEGECPFNVHAPLVRTDVIRGIGGFDESLRSGGEDWNLWQQIMRHGYWFAGLPLVAGAYRQRPKSMLHQLRAEHLDVARQMISWAEGSYAGTAHGVPFVFDKPLGSTRTSLRFTERAMQFVAAGHMTGDDNVVQAAMDGLADLPAAVVERHLGIEASIDSGFRRALALSPAEYSARTDDFSSERERVRRLIVAELDSKSAIGSPPGAATRSRSIDWLLIASDAGQVALLLETEQRLGGECLFLGLDRVDGDHGAEGALEAAGREWLSLNEASARGLRAGGLVLAWPFGDVAERLARRSRLAGIPTFLVSGPGLPTPLERARVFEIAEPIEPASLAALQPAQPVSLIGPGVDDATEKVSPRPDPAQRLLMEEFPRTQVDARQIRTFANRFAGERCVIIGNGPSLLDIDLDLLERETTFAVNGIFHAGSRFPFAPTFYVVEDSAFFEENVDRIEKFEAGHRFFPSIYRGFLGTAEQTSYFALNRGFYEERSAWFCVPRFSVDASQRLYAGQSVTAINLQLAYYMGFTEVVLVGMDFDYVIPPSVVRDGDMLMSTEDDPNHFHPDYFGPGRTWKDPKLDRVLANYLLARRMFETDGRKILNATPGGKLEAFERVDYEAHLTSRTTLSSAFAN